MKAIVEFGLGTAQRAAEPDKRPARHAGAPKAFQRALAWLVGGCDDRPARPDRCGAVGRDPDDWESVADHPAFQRKADGPAGAATRARPRGAPDALRMFEAVADLRHSGIRPAGTDKAAGGSGQRPTQGPADSGGTENPGPGSRREAAGEPKAARQVAKVGEAGARRSDAVAVGGRSGGFAVGVEKAETAVVGFTTGSDDGAAVGRSPLRGGGGSADAGADAAGAGRESRHGASAAAAGSRADAKQQDGPSGAPTERAADGKAGLRSGRNPGVRPADAASNGPLAGSGGSGTGPVQTPEPSAAAAPNPAGPGALPAGEGGHSAAARQAGTAHQAAVDQAFSKITQAHAAGRERIHLELEPPELGRVEVVLSTRNGSLHLQLSCARTEGYLQLREQLDQLAQRLLDAGVEHGGIDLGYGDGQERSAEETLPEELEADSRSVRRGRPRSRRAASSALDLVA